MSKRVHHNIVNILLFLSVITFTVNMALDKPIDSRYLMVIVGGLSFIRIRFLK